MSICEDDDMPDHATIFRWQNNNPSFREQLARARTERTEAYAGQMVALSQKALADKDTDPARIRAAVDAIDKAARLMQPKKVELTGAGGGPIKTQDLSRFTDDQLAALESILGSASDAGAGEGGDAEAEGAGSA